MKSTWTRFCLVTLSLLACVPTLWADPPDRVGRLNLVSGTVSFHPESVEEWAPATQNYPLTTGDHLWTDQDGQAEVHVGSTAMRLASHTEISFLNLNDQTIQIRLSTGSLNLRLRHLGPTEEIEIDSPNSSLSLLRAGTYRVDVQESGDTRVTLRSGEVEMTAGSSVFQVRQRQTAEVTGLDSPSYEVTDAAALDDWDMWCKARDEKEDRVASARYVSRDEMSGVEDLDRYGSWSDDPDLGPVWTPTVVVVGWAPYHFGHWAWIDPWGWTWIDDAPWGFAPFHYGRWAFRGSRWGWVPGTRTTHFVYSPALVVFVGGDGWRSSRAPVESVGWFPLGPHEPFIPPYSADYARQRNGDIDRVPYANRRVPGAVTFVPNEIFVRGQPAGGAEFHPSDEDIIGAPLRRGFAPLAPQRESYLGGYVASRGPVARPPASVMSRPVMARRTPPPQAVPFEARQRALASQPGRPLDAETLSSLRQGAPSGRLRVNVVTPRGGNEPRQPGVQRGAPQTPRQAQQRSPQTSGQVRQPERPLRRPGENWQQAEPAGESTPPRELQRQPQYPARQVRKPEVSPRQEQEPTGELAAPAEPQQRPQYPPRQARTPDRSSKQFQPPLEQPQQPAGQVRTPAQPSRQPDNQRRPTRPGSRERILDDQDGGQ